MKFSVPTTLLASSLLLALAACNSDTTAKPAAASTAPATPMVAAAPMATPPAPVVTAPAPTPAVVTPATATPEAVATVDFVKSVQPFFANYCYRCHGPTRQANRIRFDDRSVVLARRGLITPGDPDHSSLISVISAPLSSGSHMPQRSAPQPTADEIAMIKDWVAQGANWPASATVAPSPNAPAATTARPAGGDDE
jgi:uncharacterized membrane protein